MTKMYVVAIKVSIDGADDHSASLGMTEYTLDEAMAEISRLTSSEGMAQMPHKDRVSSMSFHIISVERVAVVVATTETSDKVH